MRSSPTTASRLRGHILPPESRNGTPSWGWSLDAVAETWRRGEEIRRTGGADPPVAGGDGQARALGRAHREELLSQAPPTRCVDVPTTPKAGFGGAPTVPAVSLIRVPARARPSVRWRRDDCADGLAVVFTTRSGGCARATRSTRPGRSHNSRRCCTTRADGAGVRAPGGRCPARIGARWCGRTLDWARARCADPKAAQALRSTTTSEGDEGKFYVWTSKQLRTRSGGARLGRRSRIRATERGNIRERRKCRAAGHGKERLAENPVQDVRRTARSVSVRGSRQR